MKCFVKKLAFSLAVCVSVTPCSEAVKTRSKHNNIQLKYWEQQPIRYKMSIDVISKESIEITIIVFGKTRFFCNTFRIKADSDWYLKWMKCINQDYLSVDLFILPNVVEYEEYNVRVPLILCHSKNSVCNIFIKDNPIWKFVDEYLRKYWDENWCTKDISKKKTVKCENKIGDFNEKNFISRVCHSVGDSFSW